MTIDSSAPVGPVTQRQKWIGRFVAVLVFLWILAVSFGAQGLAWMAPVLDLTSGPVSLGFLATLAQAAAIGLPLLLAAFWPVARYRAMFRTWLWAALLLLLLAPARLLPSVEQQLALVLQIGAVGIYLGLLAVSGRGQHRPGSGQVGLLVALSALLTFALPWVAWGALGSLLDSLLAITLGLATGLASSLTLALDWMPSLGKDSRGPARDVITGGFTIGVMLLIVAGGLGSNGLQLLLMVALPSLGWVAMAVLLLGRGSAEVGRRGHNWAAAAVLLGGASATILLFVDSDGLLLVVRDPILAWAGRAAGLAMLIGWGMGLVALLSSRRLAIFEPGPGYALAAMLLAAVAGMLYVGGGQFGSYGDRLFVILKDQADVSQAAEIADYDRRRQFVYQRLSEHAQISQASLRADLDGWGIAHTPYYLVNAVEAQGGLSLRLLLALRSDVDRVLASPVLRPPQSAAGVSLGSAPAPAEPPWNVTGIGTDDVWRDFGVRGQGIVVGQSDSGVQFDHPELEDGYLGRDGRHDGAWLDPWYGSDVPSDPDGHGTHTLGSILGNTVGVAPDASWMACANLPRNLGNPARYLDCLQFMLAPYPQGSDPLRDGDPTRSAHVLNNSWGCPQDFEGCDPGSLLPAVRALRAAGIYVVASAGNDGPACGSLTDPLATYDESLSVGAIDVLGNLASFSSRGPVVVDGSGRTKPDLVAPGVDILSAYPGNTYEIVSGTSMAGPHVAGVVALIWSANPGLIGDMEATDRILQESTAPFQGDLSAALPAEDGYPGERLLPSPLRESSPTCGSITQRPNNLVGYGVLDAYRAVQMALQATLAG